MSASENACTAVPSSATPHDSRHLHACGIFCLAGCAQSLPPAGGFVEVSPVQPCILTTDNDRSVNLECVSHGLLLQGSSYHWAGPAVGTERAGPANGSTLLIRPARVEDSGTYVCTFILADGQSITSRNNATVRIIGEPRAPPVQVDRHDSPSTIYLYCCKSTTLNHRYYC